MVLCKLGGDPEEDTSNSFQYGGWVGNYFVESAGKLMEKQMQPADLLLGRKTFEIFANYWPLHEKDWPRINNVTKYVMSNSMEKSDWQNSVFLKSIDAVKELKNSDGLDLQVYGSSKLIETLIKHDLVDEL